MTPSPDTIAEVQDSMRSLYKAGWNTERIARQLSSPASYGNQGITYAWCLEKGAAILSELKALESAKASAGRRDLAQAMASAFTDAPMVKDLILSGGAKPRGVSRRDLSKAFDL